jgi:Xaa-Pro aminopeptidase
MRKLLVTSVISAVLLVTQMGFALDRQPTADYRARRQALASKTNGGAVLLFAPNEAEGPNAIYGYRPDSDFFYLSGWTEPGAALLITPAIEGKGKDPVRPYTEILFLPAHNYVQEKWTGPKLVSRPGDFVNTNPLLRIGISPAERFC